MNNGAKREVEMRCANDCGSAVEATWVTLAGYILGLCEDCGKTFAENYGCAREAAG